MICTLDQAAQRTGLRSSVLVEAIESGRITGTKDLFGEWQIEAADLERFRAPLPENLDPEGPRRPAAFDPSSLEAGIGALIREAGESLRGEPDGHAREEPAPFQPVPAGPTDTGVCAPAREIDLGLTEPVRDPRPWNPEVTIGDRERIAPAAARQRGRIAIVAGSILGALAIGWVAGFGSARLYTPNAPTAFGYPKRHLGANPALRTDRIAVRVSTVSLHRPAPAHGPAPRSVAIRSPAVSQQVTGSFGPASPRMRREPELPLAPFPETRPATIEGWIVRNVVGGTVILEGPTGTWRAVQGDAVPGVGRVESIVRWGGRWIVATSGGLISTP